MAGKGKGRGAITDHRLVDKLLAQGVSQQEIARRLGVHPATIHRYKQRKMQAVIEHVHDLAIPARVPEGVRKSIQAEAKGETDIQVVLRKELTAFLARMHEAERNGNFVEAKYCVDGIKGISDALARVKAHLSDASKDTSPDSLPPAVQARVETMLATAYKAAGIDDVIHGQDALPDRYDAGYRAGYWYAVRVIADKLHVQPSALELGQLVPVEAGSDYAGPDTDPLAGSPVDTADNEQDTDLDALAGDTGTDHVADSCGLLPGVLS